MSLIKATGTIPDASLPKGMSTVTRNTTTLGRVRVHLKQRRSNRFVNQMNLFRLTKHAWSTGGSSMRTAWNTLAGTYTEFADYWHNSITPTGFLIYQRSAMIQLYWGLISSPYFTANPPGPTTPGFHFLSCTCVGNAINILTLYNNALDTTGPAFAWVSPPMSTNPAIGTAPIYSMGTQPLAQNPVIFDPDFTFYTTTWVDPFALVRPAGQTLKVNYMDAEDHQCSNPPWQTCVKT
jgi:hypothetical protein